MPLVGFTNVHGKDVKFSDIASTYKFEDWNQNLPKLLLCAAGKTTYSGVEIFASATQLIQPPRIFWMQRYTPWFETPMSQQATYLGQKTHLIFEGCAIEIEKLGWKTERSYIIPLKIDGKIINLGITPDSVDTNTNTLFDYKVSKKYKAKKAKSLDNWLNWPCGPCSDWMVQLSIYRWGLAHPDKILLERDSNGSPILTPEPEPTVIDRAILDLTVKDWSRHETDINPIETYPVPLMSIEDTDKWVRERVKYLKQYESGTKSEDYPDCINDEIWYSEDYTGVVSKTVDGKRKKVGFYAGTKENVEKLCSGQVQKIKRFEDSNPDYKIKEPHPKRCESFCFLANLGVCHQLKRDFPISAQVALKNNPSGLSGENDENESFK